MAETNLHKRTALIGWFVVGWLLTLVVVFLWFLTDTITTMVFALGIGLGLGIGFIIVVNEALILTTIQTLQKAGEEYEGCVSGLDIRTIHSGRYYDCVQPD
jgi:hypothetical protein